MCVRALAAACLAIALWAVPAGAFDLVNTGAGIVTHPNAGVGGADVSRLQVTTLGVTTTGYAASQNGGLTLADDFTLSEPATIKAITVFAYQTGSGTTSTLDGMVFRIWDGDPLLVGSSPILGDLSTDRLTSTGFTNIYRDREDAVGSTARPVMFATAGGLNIPLAPGTYWLEFQLDGNAAPGPFVPPLTLLGSAVVPGANGRQFNGGWLAADDAAPGAQPQGFPFQISGTMAPAVTGAGTATVRTRSVAVTGTVHPRGLAGSYHVEYGTAGGATVTTPEVLLSDGETPVAISVPIAGLTPNTSYSARVVAQNAMGQVSGATTFTTLRVLTLGKVTLLPARVRSGRPTVARFGLTDRARVSLVIDRAVPGRRVSGRCRPAATGLPRCTAYLRRAVVAVNKTAGSSVKIRVAGKLGGRPLAPGRYRITVIARDVATGRVSNVRRTFLTVR